MPDKKDKPIAQAVKAIEMMIAGAKSTLADASRDQKQALTIVNSTDPAIPESKKERKRARIKRHDVEIAHALEAIEHGENALRILGVGVKG